jgi:hypothetical protein
VPIYEEANYSIFYKVSTAPCAVISLYAQSSLHIILPPQYCTQKQVKPTIPPRVAENPAYRKPTHALHHNNVNICQETLKLSEYTLHTLTLVSTCHLLLLSSVALTIPCLVVDVPNSLSSVSLGRALRSAAGRLISYGPTAQHTRLSPTCYRASSCFYEQQRNIGF